MNDRVKKVYEGVADIHTPKCILKVVSGGPYEKIHRMSSHQPVCMIQGHTPYYNTHSLRRHASSKDIGTCLDFPAPMPHHQPL